MSAALIVLYDWYPGYSDPTPVHTALWRVVTNCISVKKVANPASGKPQWVYDNPEYVEGAQKKNNRIV